MANDPTQSPGRMRPHTWFYLGAAVVMAALAFLGFRHFFLEGRAHPGREIPPPIRTLVIVHGATMSAWLVVLVVQAALIRLRAHRLHMTVGKLGIALATVVSATGLWVAIQSARGTPAEVRIWGLEAKAFLAVPLFSIVLFALFVVLGVHWRRRPAAHRSMMLLATLAALGAAISRIDVLSELYVGTVLELWFGPFFFTLCLGAVLAALRWLVCRTPDLWLSGGVVLLTAASALIMATARSAAWLQFATMLTG